MFGLGAIYFSYTAPVVHACVSCLEIEVVRHALGWLEGHSSLLRFLLQHHPLLLPLLILYLLRLHWCHHRRDRLIQVAMIDHLVTFAIGGRIADLRRLLTQQRLAKPIATIMNNINQHLNLLIIFIN